MAYVLTDGGNTVVTYPYNIGLLRRDNPNVSFPASPTLDQLVEWNVFPVTPENPPAFNVITENLVEDNPILTESGWVQRWQVSAASEAEAAERRATFEASAREQATALLRASDVYVVESVELSKALHPDFAAYRAALRNPAALAGYPVATMFPELPANTLEGEVDLSDEFVNAT